MSDVPFKVLERKFQDAEAKKWVCWLALNHPQVCGDEIILYLFFMFYVYKLKLRDFTISTLRRCYRPGTLSRRLRELRDEEKKALMSEGMDEEKANVRPWNRFAPLPETAEKRAKQRIVIRNYYADKNGFDGESQTDLSGFVDGGLFGNP